MTHTHLWSRIPADWQKALLPFYSPTSSSWKKLEEAITKARQESEVYPSEEKTFYALECTPFANIRIVILGQDPYHQPGQAHGLAFSVPEQVPIPPSLRNIFKELHDDLGYTIPLHGNLTHWAQHGVLLLNTTLTVSRDKPASHAHIGWNEMTSSIICAVNALESPIVFFLFGRHAQEKKALIRAPQHTIIERVHPSPLSAYRGFLGSKPFSEANRIHRKNLFEFLES